MAQFLIVFPAGSDQGMPGPAACEEIEAVLPVRFPDDRFRFVLSVGQGGGIRVTEISGRPGPMRSTAARIAAAIEEIVRAHAQSPSRSSP